MTDNEIKSNLCHYDEDNPYNILDLFEDDRPQPRNGCACDNCFYGRDKLAVQVLETQRELAAERALADQLAEVLQRIANEDYRGNRPHHCAVAYYGVKVWKEARSE